MYEMKRAFSVNTRTYQYILLCKYCYSECIYIATEGVIDLMHMMAIALVHCKNAGCSYKYVPGKATGSLVQSTFACEAIIMIFMMHVIAFIDVSQLREIPEDSSGSPCATVKQYGSTDTIHDGWLLHVAVPIYSNKRDNPNTPNDTHWL